MWLCNTKGSSGFSSSSTAEEVTEGIDASGLTAIVTGASSGIGTETARVLALRGVHVTIAVRNMAAGQKVREAIVKEIPEAKIDVMELDLCSKASVRRFASEFNSLGHPLNILINNAGIMGAPFKLSQDNIELQFATNHLGHFLLTNLLLDTMKKTYYKSKKEGRIVNVSSDAHRYTYREGIRFDRISDEKGYSNFFAYCQSKLANLLHSYELARRFKEEGVEITANSVHPGVIISNVFHRRGCCIGLANKLDKFVFKTLQQGASTTCYAALHPQVKGISGAYFRNNNIAKASSKAMDADLASRLWEFSLNLVKQNGDDS
ncbi:short-chain dehydrogenase TIC 32, chloroplastic [Coffea arabica]|uniref:Short-chain dehydrogenase TIC 32, chloroplastic n=1 Tax=Coffea arabica TaxID=13443 RepID=A0A6P6VDA2_COFAR|nr:short-chain dehydrogenase TIC 32, chloroplastic-like [Coffea arabica]